MVACFRSAPTWLLWQGVHPTCVEQALLSTCMPRVRLPSCSGLRRCTAPGLLTRAAPACPNSSLLGGRPQPPLAPGQAEPEMLPDSVVQAMLTRELLLTRAKLHALTYEHIMGERKMRAFKSQLKQARGMRIG